MAMLVDAKDPKDRIKSKLRELRNRGFIQYKPDDEEMLVVSISNAARQNLAEGLREKLDEGILDKLALEKPHGGIFEKLVETTLPSTESSDKSDRAMLASTRAPTPQDFLGRKKR